MISETAYLGGGRDGGVGEGERSTTQDDIEDERGPWLSFLSFLGGAGGWVRGMMSG